DGRFSANGSNTSSNTSSPGEIYKKIWSTLDGGINHLGIVTDSKFTQSCATEWGPRWAKNSWKLANGENAKLKEPVKRLLEAINESGIEITWVRFFS
ncbi:unnamed protein product, partial [Trichobilharzia regenti]